VVFALWFFSVVGTWLAKAGGDAERTLAWAAAAGGAAAVLLILVGLLLFYGAAYQVAGARELAVVRGLTDAGNASIEMSKFGVTLDLLGAAPAILWILCLSAWMTGRAGSARVPDASRASGR
jgi:hypothetical protein